MVAQLQVPPLFPFDNPTAVSLTANATLSAAANFVVRVTSNNNSWILTVPNAKSHKIDNISTTTSFELRTTGNSDQQVQPGTTVWVAWDHASSTHKIHVDSASVDLAMSSSSFRPVANAVIKSYVDSVAGGGGGGVIDDVMSDSSTNAVQNQVIKDYVDQHGRVSDADQIVTGAVPPNATTDAASLTAAVLALNTNFTTNGIAGTLWLDGEVLINSAHIWKFPPRIKGLDTKASLRVTHANAQIACGPNGLYYDPIDTTANVTVPSSSAIVATADFADSFEVDNPSFTFTAASATDVITATGHTFVNGNCVRVTTSGTLPAPLAISTDYFIRDVSGSTFKLATTINGTAINLTTDGVGTHTVSEHFILAEGDWVALWADNALTGLAPHIVGGANCPMEMHQVSRDNGLNVYSIADFIRDGLITNPRVRKVPILSMPGSNNVSAAEFSDFRIRQDAGIANLRLFDLRCLNGVEFAKVDWEMSSATGGPGHVYFNFCANIHVRQCNNLGLERFNIGGEGYWWQNGVVNGALYERLTSRHCRHAVDTTSGSSDATTRWGTPRGVRVMDSIFYVEGDPAIGSLIACSTHSEGWGVTFEGNEFHLSAATNNGSALTARARNTRFIDNDVYGGDGGAKGCIVNADDCEIIGNRFHDIWRCVVQDSTTRYRASGTLIKDNVFKRYWQAGPIHLLGGSDTEITGNLFEDGDQCAIEIQGPQDGVDINHNDFHDTAAGGTQGVIHVDSKVSFTFTADASTDRLTATSNTFQEGQQLYLTTTGTLPGGLSPHVVYYAKDVDLQVADQFKLATTFAGTAINITDTGSGTHTVTLVNEVTNLNICHNDFRDCNEIAIDIGGSGDGHHIKHNTFHNCGASAAIIKLAGGKNHRIAGNDMPNESNTNSVNLGSLTGVTFTVDAGTDFITAAGHTLLDGDVVVVSSSTTLPAGLTANTLYYVRDLQANGTFKVSATQGGSAVNITDTGTGTHTITETCHVTIIDNCMDGYGSGSMGLTGTLASTVNTAQAANNRVDP